MTLDELLDLVWITEQRLCCQLTDTTTVIQTLFHGVVHEVFPRHTFLAPVIYTFSHHSFEESDRVLVEETGKM